MQRLFVLGIGALIATSPAQAKALKWMDGPPGLPGGAKFAVVSGNPGKEGMFTIRAKLPANYAVPPHHHPADERVSVLSGGQLSYGMGDKLDRDHAVALTKGYHVNLKAGMNHWAFNTDPVVIQVTGMGPFAIIYADPKDDPRTGAK